MRDFRWGLENRLNDTLVGMSDVEVQLVSLDTSAFSRSIYHISVEVPAGMVRDDTTLVCWIHVLESCDVMLVEASDRKWMRVEQFGPLTVLEKATDLVLACFKWQLSEQVDCS